jgi:hypothetical protein
MAFTDYTASYTAMQHWVEDISPRYFNFDATQLHRTGVFGYINEVMSTVNMDTYHGVTVARREFYPNTALYTKSLFKMAALQQIAYPLANPAEASCTLVLKEDELVKYGVLEEGATDVYKIVLDNDMIMMADNIPFMLDYPIKIIFKKTAKTSKAANDTISQYTNRPGVVHITGDKIFYTVSYDITYENSMNTQREKYLKHRTLQYAGENLLLIQMGIRQCKKDVAEQMINISPTVSVITLDYPFTGNLCSFEVFYTPNGTETPIQLTKIPLNGTPINKPFCMYSLTNDNIIKIHFPENIYFTPRFNSKITLHIYTTMGEAGNFRLFNGELLCSPSSEIYDYNQSLTVQGQILGSSQGGYDMPNFEDFRQSVVRAYATNKVIGTDQDLQMYFNERARASHNKILFFKRRDDVFERLYGAFMLMKDYNNDVIPTNSLVADVRILEDFNDDEKMAYAYGVQSLPTTLVIKPGSIWRYTVPHHMYYEGNGYHVERAYNTTTITTENYKDLANTYDADMQAVEWQFENGQVRELSIEPDDGTGNYAANFIGERVFNRRLKSRLSLGYDISDSTEELLYANPFLISISRTRNSVSYYLNSFDTYSFLNMTDVNDSSYIQFINTAMLLKRNALIGENFYKLTIKLQPTVPSDELRKLFIISKEELANIEQTVKETGIPSEFVSEDFPVEIRADYAGEVMGYKWLSTTKYYCRCKETQGKENHGEICPVCHSYVTAHVDQAIYQVIRYTPDPNWHVTYDDITHYEHQEGLDDTDEFGNFLSYIRVSPAMSEMYIADVIDYDSSAWYDTMYQPGDRFGQYDILATRKCKDLLTLRVIGEFANVPGMYIPFFIEDYESSGDVYTLSAYLATNDEISDDGKLVITGGFYYDDSLEKNIPYVEPVAINPYNCVFNVSTFVRYDDIFGNTVNGYTYLKNHTFTNLYSNSGLNNLNLLKKFDFIRSTVIESPDSANAIGSLLHPHRLTIKEIPLVRANWIKKSYNFSLLIKSLNENHDFIEQTYDLLENNYTIDMKFFNTYGKAKYYDIGIGDPELDSSDQMLQLNTVNISLRFGVRISSLVDRSIFESRFIDFVRNYIERLNDLDHDGESINLLDMVTDINNEFGEIERLEYYGIDDLDASRAQIITSWSADEIKQLGYKEYIPEFINVYMKYNLGTDKYEPAIEITYLDE